MLKIALNTTLTLSIVVSASIESGHAQTTMSKSSDQSAGAKAEKIPPAAVSNDPTATTASFGDWIMRCTKVDSEGITKLCEVTQTFTAQGQTSPLAQVAIGRIAPKEPLKITIVLPTNVTITLAPQILGDGDSEVQGLPLVWQRCLPGGCFASAPVQSDALTRWLSAAKPGAMLFADGSGQKIKLPISFNGLQQALDMLGDK